jgi:hypothetical protein
VKLDGKVLDSKAIPLVNDAQKHKVEVILRNMENRQPPPE